MPTHLNHFEIDWRWPDLSEAERAAVRRHEARLRADPWSHTLTTFSEALAEASRELPGRTIHAHVEDEDGEHSLAAQDGRCSEGRYGSCESDGKFPGLLTIDDYRAAGVEKLYVGLFWPGGMLRAIEEQASRLDRSLSWLVQKAWSVAKDSPSNQAAAHEFPPAGERRKQSIYLPIELFAELSEIAAREDRSMSWVIQRALSSSWSAITALAPESD